MSSSNRAALPRQGSSAAALGRPASSLHARVRGINGLVGWLPPRRRCEPAKTRDGRALRYGIGWFTQTFAGKKLVWHYGYGSGSSALLLRVPSRKLALIVLANSGNMSGSTRLGYGNVLDSPFAVAFLKHFVFVRDTPHASPQHGGDAGGLRKAVTDLWAKDVHPIYHHELFAQAVVRELMAGTHRDSRRAVELLHLLRELRPKFLPGSGITGLELLSRFDDEKLNPTTEELRRNLLRDQPSHPAVLSFAAQFFEKTGRPEAAITWLQQLADSDFVDDELTFDACVKVGQHFAARDPKRARAYYWRAVQIGWASPGYPRAKVDRAIELLNATDRP